MFFLLATFIMVSLSMIRNQAVAVHLPAATTSAPQEPSELAAITITESGDIYFNKEPSTLIALSQQLIAFKASHQDPKVVIHGDKNALFGRAIEILDEVRKLGIAKVAIQTQSK